MQISDHACTQCGCLCDDLRLTVIDGRIVKAEGACSLAEPWFLGQDSQQPAAAEVDGQPVTLDVALDWAAAILRSARAPLIYGMSQSSTDGQRAALSLARRIRATIDTPASTHPAILAMQESGQSTCSLGEVKNRADLVIFWGANPVESHPRLLERCGILPRRDKETRRQGDKEKKKKRNKEKNANPSPCRIVSLSPRLIVVDAHETATSQQADRFIQLETGGDFEALWTLRGLLRGQTLESESVVGMPAAQLHELAQLMKGCRYGVVFFGPGLTRTGLAHRNVEALLRLVDDLNDHTRFHAQSLLGTGPRTDEVLTWQTGFPFGVNLAAGYPRYNPGEFSAHDLLDRGEVDAILVMGCAAANKGTRRQGDKEKETMPVSLSHCLLVSLSDRGPPSKVSVRITTAIPGIDVSGTAYRMDGVAIPLRPVLPARFPSDAEILQQIEERVAGYG